jgi:hypothetical protein
VVIAMNDTPPLLPDFVPWDHARTRGYLDANPLPVGFHWPDEDGVERPVRPRHTSVTGYGKWLQETPYFPGLFELIHGILVHAPMLGDADWLATEVARRRPPKQPEFSL